MLEKVIIKNFKSIQDRMIIDFKASKYTALTNENTYNNILKGLFFYGANASGKTNVLDAITFLLNSLFINDFDMSFSECLFNNENIILEYIFNEEDNIIDYFLEIDRNHNIIQEILKLNDEELLRRIKTSAITSLTETRSYGDDSIDEKTLFLKNIYFNTKFKSYDILSKWFNYMQNSIYLNFNKKIYRTFSNNTNIMINNYHRDEDIELINNFLKESGVCEEIKYTNSMKIGLNYHIETGDNKIFFLKKNKCDYWMPIFLESQGNVDLLEILPSIIHGINNDCLIIMDEFNTSFHNQLQEIIIKYLMRYSKQTQSIISSHSTNILKNSLVRPDQIYAVSFNGNNGTLINRFSNERPRTSQNLEKMYLSGIFGGLPNYE